MPLPREPFTIHGGCNCKAIRYRISVPPHKDRVLSPYCTPGGDIGDHRLPVTQICHCNDCRHATAQLPSFILMALTSSVQVSAAPTLADIEALGNEHTWTPGTEMFDHTNTVHKETWLGLYKSTPVRSRWFCKRCGVQIAYNLDAGSVPEEWGWPVMVNFCLGTVDREYLEKDYMKPDHANWTALGIPWVRDLVTKGRVDEHPLFALDRGMGDDITADVEELEGLGLTIKSKISIVDN
ncbi:uncharacterized protein BCR38DRAFT_413166 [Pseudomassariella vexata]|uniref:Mss4-like protein n=1 Tax=Pseudomassariella vexata TaxID=1141098 RepID=A0A1Y2DHX9_9PEZI|nr:uncharacterized protein BCR38DRAFT_413166 [Pseudomassariella vexata]ORY58849.1 hypothetical protein BCR38DRAFT_413166 [Pseudomassariella vexata]